MASMADEVRVQLADTGFELVGVKMFEAKVREMCVLYVSPSSDEKRDPDWFNIDENFKKAVGDVVDCK